MYVLLCVLHLCVIKDDDDDDDDDNHVSIFLNIISCS